MELPIYIVFLKNIQHLVLDFLDNSENIEENFQNLIQEISDQQIPEDVNKLKLFIYMINNISLHHNRSKNFISKIERIILMFKKEIQEYFTNDDLLLMFKNNKRILLSLIKNELLTLKSDISNSINEIDKFGDSYFFNVKNDVLNETKFVNFEENQNNGENELQFCELIRKDLISEFIVYVNKNDLPLNSKIKASVFETNNYLTKREPTLIEYAAFFGSIQIFTFLYKNNAKITQTIWIYSIHGNNSELIHFLEDIKIKPANKSYEKCLKEAIKCHHNEMAEYIKYNYLEDKIEINELINSKSLKYYNFEFIQEVETINRKFFYYLCKYDYYCIIYQILKSNHDNNSLINSKTKDTIKKELYLLKPWQISIINNHLNIFELIREYQDIDINEKYMTCIWSEKECEYHIFKYLIDNNNISIINYFINNENLDINSIQYEKNYTDNYIQYFEYPLLYHAIKQEKIEIVKILLSNSKINVNSEIVYFESKYNRIKEPVNRNTSLILSILTQNEEIFKLLLNHPKIDVNQVNVSQIDDFEQISTPLFHSIKSKNIEFVKNLLDHKDIDVNLKYKFVSQNQMLIRSAFHEAIVDNEIEIVKLLLKNPKINVNDINIDENIENYSHTETSALYIAVDNEYLDIVDLLLNHKDIDVNYKSLFKNQSDKSLMPILNNAIKKGNLKIVRNLLKNKNIDVNSKSYLKILYRTNIQEKEETALQCAINNENTLIIDLLLSHKDIDIGNKSKVSVFNEDLFYSEEKTALQFAVVKNRRKSVSFIIEFLKKKNKITNEELIELINLSTDDYIKSYIYTLI